MDEYVPFVKELKKKHIKAEECIKYLVDMELDDSVRAIFGDNSVIIKGTNIFNEEYKEKCASTRNKVAFSSDIPYFARDMITKAITKQNPGIELTVKLDSDETSPMSIGKKSISGPLKGQVPKKILNNKFNLSIAKRAFKKCDWCSILKYKHCPCNKELYSIARHELIHAKENHGIITAIFEAYKDKTLQELSQLGASQDIIDIIDNNIKQKINRVHRAQETIADVYSVVDESIDNVLSFENFFKEKVIFLQNESKKRNGEIIDYKDPTHPPVRERLAMMRKLRKIKEAEMHVEDPKQYFFYKIFPTLFYYYSVTYCAVLYGVVLKIFYHNFLSHAYKPKN